MRALDDIRKLDRYIEIKAQIAALNEELESLKPEILSALWEEPDQKYEHKGCDFSVGERRTWEYSVEVKEKESWLKTLKKHEQATGTAIVKRHSSFIVMKT